MTTTTARPDTGVAIAELRRLVGSEGVRQVARHPVNEVMIAHWCDAMGDENPCYTDPAFAATSVHGGIVAPPVMLDVWDKKGLRSVRDPSSPRARVINELDAHGFVSTVAVNSELTITRYLRPGEVIGNVEVLDDVSAEKQTALGVGHFVTTRHRYTNETGEHVGDVLFRILKFRPGTGRATGPSTETSADGEGRPGPDPDPALRPRPAINRDNQYFWDGARRHKLRIQRCERCGRLSFPPSPRCPECGSFAMGFIVASGRGTLYAWAVPHHPQANGFRYPVLVGLVELEEGTRLVTNIVACAREHLRIGMPLEVCWLDSHPALVEGATDSRGPITLPQFRPARPPRRETTLTIGEVAAGDVLPLAPIPITPTLIVSGALATRDYTEVHHDRDVAVARGSKDIFMNIHTSLGLLQRYVTDWAGPEALVRAVRVRLGAPNYPYDTMTMTGEVSAVDADTGTVAISARGYNSLGDHVTGTVELALPGARGHGDGA